MAGCTMTYLISLGIFEQPKARKVNCGLSPEQDGGGSGHNRLADGKTLSLPREMIKGSGVNDGGQHGKMPAFSHLWPQ